jgi:hypothetical protein
MTSPIKLPMDWLRGLAVLFMPDTAAVLRYTETSTSDGVSQDWQAVLTGVPCSVSPRGTRAYEGLDAGGAFVRSLSPWIVSVPFDTAVTEHDRVTVTGGDRTDDRTFEVVRVDERSYEGKRNLECELMR